MQPSLKVALPVTPDVSNFSFKLERCTDSVFGGYETDRRTDGRGQRITRPPKRERHNDATVFTLRLC